MSHLNAGCVLLCRVSPTWFHLEDNTEIGASLRIHGGQIEAYIKYDTMLHMGEQENTAPIGYNQFAQIFNVAPRVPVTFAYIPEGQETLMGLEHPKPNRDDFKVTPRDLYNVRQVAP